MLHLINADGIAGPFKRGRISRNSETSSRNRGYGMATKTDSFRGSYLHRHVYSVGFLGLVARGSHHPRRNEHRSAYQQHGNAKVSGSGQVLSESLRLRAKGELEVVLGNKKQVLKFY